MSTPSSKAVAPAEPSPDLGDREAGHLPRREFLGLGLFGSAFLVSGCGGGGSADVDPQGPPVVEPVAPPVVEPVVNPVGPKPSAWALPYRYGTWRMHNPETSWRTIQPTRGAYLGNGTDSDRQAMVLDWRSFDAQLNEALKFGISVVFSAWLTPAWASRPEDQITGDNKVLGPWQVAGESAVPEKPQYVYDFVLAVLRRANASARRIAYLETLNEPEFWDAPTMASQLASGRRPFWLGTAVQAVAYAEAAWRAATDFNATVVESRRVTVLCPAEYDIHRLDAFLTARDPASGRLGHETFDWMNIHPYTASPNQAIDGIDLFHAGGSRIGVAACARALARVGLPPRPVAVTEWGLHPKSSNPKVAAFAALTALERRTYITRLLAMAALDGVALFTFFSNGVLAGDFDNDVNGVIAGVTEIHNKLAGQTIVAGGFLADGRVTATLATGATHVW